MLPYSLEISLAVHVSDEALHVQFEHSRVVIQPNEVESALIGEQQIMHLPELGLPAGALCDLGRMQRMWMEVLQREMPEDKAKLPTESPEQHFDCSRRLLTFRALEISVLDDSYRRIEQTEYVICTRDGIDQLNHWATPSQRVRRRREACATFGTTAIGSWYRSKRWCPSAPIPSCYRCVFVLVLGSSPEGYMKMTVLDMHGLIGRKIAEALRRRQHDIVAISADVEHDPDELARTLVGIEVVIDAADPPAQPTTDDIERLEQRCRFLVSAASAARVNHLVALSEVGTHRLDAAYWRAQRARETLIEVSPVPHTILRATQMFEFMDRSTRSIGSERSIRVAPACIQPILSDEVAAALADLTLGPPRNATLEMGGPERLRLDDALRQFLRVSRSACVVITDEHAPYLGAKVAGDDLVPDQGAIFGVTRFEEWLYCYAPDAYGNSVGTIRGFL